MAKENLYAKAKRWEDQAMDARDCYGYSQLLTELDFQAELRFCDYVQYRQETFPVRLDKWLNNLTTDREQQALLKLLAHLIFVDSDQMTALYRDAFRRVIGRWIIDPVPSIDEMLNPGFFERQCRALAECRIAAVTESCDIGRLLKASDLNGLPRPVVLGPTVPHALTALAAFPKPLKGLIVCEDIVGTGRQAGKILKAVEENLPEPCRLLFVPLIAFEKGVVNLKAHYLKRTCLSPIVVIPDQQCLRKEPAAGEPHLFKSVRGIINKTAQRVLQAENERDDPPADVFGFENSGGLIITCHNAPNNTLPLIHHKAPMWNALFRRLHHKERT